MAIAGTTHKKWDLSSNDGPAGVPWRNLRADASTFRTTGSRWDFGAIILIDARQNPCTYSVRPDIRSLECPARVSMLFMHTGTCTIRGGQSLIVIGPGETGWVTERSGLSVSSDEVSHITIVSLASQVLEDSGVHLADSSGSFSQSSNIIQPARTYLRALIAGMASPGIGEDFITISVVVDTLHQLLSALFLHEQDTAPRQVQNTGLYTHARALIRNQCADPDLTPHRLAQELNVSLRQLRRSFQENQQTVQGTIRACRTL